MNKKISTKKFSIIIIVLCVIGIGGYFAFKNLPSLLASPDATASPTITPQSSPEVTPTPTVSPVVSPSNGYSQQRPSRTTIDKNKPMVALTIDDGPDPNGTLKILSTLKKHNARATFFMLGSQVVKYPDMAAQVYKEGHQVGSHTFSHKDLRKVSLDKAKSEIETTQQAVFDAIGIYPNVIRPPYGKTTPDTLSISKMPNIMWNIDPEDWKTDGTKHIVENGLTAKDGDIILVHDIFSNTAKAIEELVPALIQKGYQIVTIDELFEAKGIDLKPGVIYYNGK